MPAPTLPDDKGDKGLGAWTPGPWQIKSDYTAEDRRTVIANVDGETFPDGSTSYSFDPVARCEDEFGEYHDAAEANARLIAAAPELFEACSAWIEYLETDAPGSACDELRMLDAMRAAIAKARGK